MKKYRSYTSHKRDNTDRITKRILLDNAGTYVESLLEAEDFQFTVMMEKMPKLDIKSTKICKKRVPTFSIAWEP